MTSSSLLAESLPAWVEPFLQTDFKGVASLTSQVVLYEEGHLQIREESDRFHYRERVVMRILKPSHAAGQERALLPFNGQDHVTSLQGWIQRPNGEVKRMDPKTVTETSDFSAYVLYSDIRYHHILLPVNCVSCIFAFEFEKEGVSSTPSWSWIFGGSWPSSPTLKSVFKLTLPPGGRYRWKTDNAEGVRFEAGGDSLQWVVESIGPLKWEPAMPPPLQLVPQLRVDFSRADQRLITTWNDVALWFWSLYESQRELTREIQLLTNELVSGLEDPLEKIQRLAGFVRQNIRYVAIEVGIGGYQPHPAGVILEQGYGDCKDKVTLLAAMLSAAGFVGHPALVYTHDRTRTDPGYPSFGFNHMILALEANGIPRRSLNDYSAFSAEAGLLWIDPTAETAPLGYLPASVQARYALVVRSDGGLLSMTPSISARENSSHRKISGRLTTDGRLIADCIEQFSGELSMLTRHHFTAVPEPKAKALLEERFGSHGVPRVTQLSLENLEPDQGNLALHYDLDLSNFGKRVGSLFILPALLLSTASRYALKSDERTHPIDFTLGIDEEDQVALSLPTNWHLQDSSPIEFSSDFGTYELRLSLADSTLRVYRHFRLDQPRIPVDRIPDFRAFIQKVQNADKTQLLLRISSD